MPVFTLNLQEDDGRITPISLNLDEAIPHQKTVLGELLHGSFYEPDVSIALCRILSPGDTFVDVGANLGYVTLLAAAKVGAGGRVIAFEPGEMTQAELRGNIALNPWAGRIDVVGKVASDSVGETDFYLNQDDAGGNALWDPSRFPTSRSTPRLIRVPTTRLDVELRELLGPDAPPPKAMKIDTEGAEFLILRGLGDMLDASRLPIVICELHYFGLEQLGANQEQLRGLMSERGYETFILSRRGFLPLWVPPRVPIRSRFLLNLIFATRETIGRYWPIADFPAEPY